MKLLLIHPPHVKPSEPPAGIPILCKAVRDAGHFCTVCDMNIEGIHYLLENSSGAPDTWSKRALKNKHQHLLTLKSEDGYHSLGKYTRAVSDLNRLLELEGKSRKVSLSFSNYLDQKSSPVNSEDLLEAAAHFTENIYFSYFSDRFEQLFDEAEYDYVGFSLNYLSQALITFSMIGYLRHHFPKIKIIVGGGLITTWTKLPTWADQFASLIDHTVSGAGTRKLLNLLGTVSSATHFSPDFSEFQNNPYFAPGLVIPYAAALGCFWKKCSFCPETTENNPYLPTATKQLTEDLNTIYSEYSPRLVHFLDNAINPTFLKQLIKFPLKMPWYGFVRFTTHLTDLNFCHDLKRSGCTMLKLGLESGSQPVLDALKKGIKLEMVQRSLYNLRAAGIKTYVYLLFGTPSETEEDAHRTMRFIIDHADEITCLNLAIFNLPVGSMEVDQLEVSGFYHGDLSLYTDFKHPDGWGRKQVRQFLDNEFRRHSAIRKILQQDPPLFTSNHAPFFGE